MSHKPGKRVANQFTSTPKGAFGFRAPGEPIERPSVIWPQGPGEIRYLQVIAAGGQDRIVDGNPDKKNRQRKTAGGKTKTNQAVGTRAAERRSGGQPQGTDVDEGMSPALQAHIGQHVRAVFDEVAQEPIPEHLLRLLKDLDRNGDK
jgi:Anti-sigma factor NepR